MLAAALIFATCSGTNFFEALSVGVDVFSSAVDLSVGVGVGLSMGKEVVLLRSVGGFFRSLSLGVAHASFFYPLDELWSDSAA